MNALIDMVKSSRTKNSFTMSDRNQNENDKEKNPIIYIYQIINKLITTNEVILSYYIENQIISTLLGKLDEEKKFIREIIYPILIYTIKKTNDYKKELFDLKEDEKEGEYDFREKQRIKYSIDKDIINILFDEKKELLILLLIMFEYDDESFMKEFNKNVYRLFDEYKEKNRDEDLIEIILALIKIND